jgi:hypothetical protein
MPVPGDDEAVPALDRVHDLARAMAEIALGDVLVS